MNFFTSKHVGDTINNELATDRCDAAINTLPLIVVGWCFFLIVDSLARAIV